MKKKALFLLKVIIALLLIWYLFASGRLSIDALRIFTLPGNAGFLSVSAALFLCSQLLSAFRLILLLRTIGITLPAGAAMNLTMFGNFFNMVLPGVVGGDVLKGYYLTKGENEGKGRGAGIIFMDRFLGLFSLALIAFISILYLLRYYEKILGRFADALHIVLAVITVMTLMLLAIMIAAGVPSMRRKLKEIASRIFKQSMFYYMADGLAKLARRKRVVLITIVISIMVQLMGLTGVLALVFTLPERPPDIVALMAVTSIVSVIGSIPVTPGNIGWIELLASLGWSAVGSGLGGQILFTWRIVTMLTVAPWGIYYLFSSRMHVIPRKKEQHT